MADSYWARRVGVLFLCGMIGGGANSLALWLAGAARWTRAIGVEIAPALSWYWLEPRLFWGGLWALPLLLWPDALRWRPISTGIVLSLLPTANQLLIVFPRILDKGLFGLDLGLWTPVVVVLANAIWGVVTAVLAVRWLPADEVERGG